MVGWIPKLIYTQTNIAIVFFFFWIKQVYCHWSKLTLYLPSSIHKIECGCYDFFSLHWPLLVFIAELVICKGIIYGIKRNAPVLTIKASSTEKVSPFDISSVFTIIPVIATLMSDMVNMQLFFILAGLLFYETFAFTSGCSNLTMALLGYKEYKIISKDNMSHRILTEKKIRKGDDSHYVIEFNDIYVKV